MLNLYTQVGKMVRFLSRFLPAEFDEKGTCKSILSVSVFNSISSALTTTAILFVVGVVVVVLPFSCTLCCCTTAVDTATELGTLILVASSCILFLSAFLYAITLMLLQFHYCTELPEALTFKIAPRFHKFLFL